MTRGDDPEPDAPVEDQPNIEERAWRRYEAAVRRRLAATTEAANARRGKSRLFDIGFLIADRNRVLPASLLVGAMASRIVIYAVPLFALLALSFGIYGDVTTQDPSVVARNSGMAALIASSANTEQ